MNLNPQQYTPYYWKECEKYYTLNQPASWRFQDDLLPFKCKEITLQNQIVTIIFMKYKAPYTYNNIYKLL